MNDYDQKEVDKVIDELMKEELKPDEYGEFMNTLCTDLKSVAITNNMIDIFSLVIGVMKSYTLEALVYELLAVDMREAVKPLIERNKNKYTKEELLDGLNLNTNFNCRLNILNYIDILNISFDEIEKYVKEKKTWLEPRYQEWKNKTILNQV